MTLDECVRFRRWVHIGFKLFFKLHDDMDQRFIQLLGMKEDHPDYARLCKEEDEDDEYARSVYSQLANSKSPCQIRIKARQKYEACDLCILSKLLVREFQAEHILW